MLSIPTWRVHGAHPQLPVYPLMNKKRSRAVKHVNRTTDAKADARRQLGVNNPSPKPISRPEERAVRGAKDAGRMRMRWTCWTNSEGYSALCTPVVRNITATTINPAVRLADGRELKRPTLMMAQTPINAESAHRSQGKADSAGEWGVGSAEDLVDKALRKS